MYSEFHKSLIKRSLTYVQYSFDYSSNFTPQMKEGGNQLYIFNRRSISRNITHRQSYHLIQTVFFYLNEMIRLTMCSAT